ncbi:MAG TPA: TonB-dependent receptor plug domain-containing protein, partial [Acidimicrobiia bacterium]|nr:TonB-dependent receptor plug domain-containing protein [Acidimicrobiia bacterium]
MHHARHTLFVAAASVCLAGPAAAQQSDTARIAPVVVTATRVPIIAAASPATIDVITGDELRLRGATSIASALQMLPGVTFAQSGSFGSATSLFLRGGESKYVKVLIDGVPVNDPGGAMDFGSLTTDNVERIELVRGPASVLYGADAVTGVIQ